MVCEEIDQFLSSGKKEIHSSCSGAALLNVMNVVLGEGITFFKAKLLPIETWLPAKGVLQLLLAGPFGTRSPHGSLVPIRQPRSLLQS